MPDIVLDIFYVGPDENSFAGLYWKSPVLIGLNKNTGGEKFQILPFIAEILLEFSLFFTYFADL
jgi:hypothetical protein